MNHGIRTVLLATSLGLAPLLVMPAAAQPRPPAAIQETMDIGDEPGRKEPTTGEINYKNVFKYIYDRSKKEGKSFIMGMEHGNSKQGKEGEEALIKAYVESDNFAI